MRLFRTLRVTILAGLLPLSIVVAQEPSIDNLLKKLPPPEKLVKNPVQRASHILALHGVDVAFETNTAMPAAFLGQQLELREALENATRAKDVKSLEALEKSIARDKQALEQKLAQRIDADKDYQAAAGLVRELQFLEKLEAEIDGAYEVIE